MKKKKLLIFILLILTSVALNCFFILREILPYIRARNVAQNIARKRINPSELTKYKVDMVKEVKWWFRYEDPRQRFFNDFIIMEPYHFTVLVKDDGSVMFFGLVE